MVCVWGGGKSYRNQRYCFHYHITLKTEKQIHVRFTTHCREKKCQVSTERKVRIYIYDNCKYTWPNPYSYQSDWLKNWNILCQQPELVQYFSYSWLCTVVSLLMKLVDPLTKYCNASFAQPDGYCLYCLSIEDFLWISKRKNGNLIICSNSFK